jgi:chromosome segregation protein
LPVGASVVTPAGDWLGAGWFVRPSQKDARGGVIQRKAALDAVAAEIAAAEAKLTHVDGELAAAREARAAAEQSKRELESALKQRLDERGSVLAEKGALVSALEQSRQRSAQIQAELAEASQQFDAEQSALAQARAALQEAIDTMARDGQQRTALESERETLAEALRAAREVARTTRDAAHSTDVRVQSLSGQVETVTGAISRLEQQVAQLASRAEELTNQLPETDDPDAALRAELEQLLADRIEAEAALTSARQAVADHEHALREQDKHKVTIEHRLQNLHKELESGKLQQAERNVRIENLETQLRELDSTATEVIAQLPEGATEPEWQVKVERVAARIARLGPINLAAIDEYAKASERKTYLDAQNDDLQEALQTLEGAIRKIDRETRSRFKETFDQINAGFAELFPRVFGGGTASLEMTGDDLLDTGVAIMARPPGKKNSTIHLLSGGEKAMTAIALVFSIFQLNPAPFCMLDEVDAPLDDANVGRYARMVKEMSEKVQFIFITHNKITMEVADHLMGVTMHEPGVSRLVTVDIEEAAQLAAS